MLAHLQFTQFRILLVSCLVASGLLPTSAAARAQSLSRSQPQTLANYSKLPLSFEVNHGQADSNVKFLSRGSGYSLFLTDNGAELTAELILAKPADCSPSERRNTPPDVAPTQPSPCSNNSVAGQEVVRMTLVGTARDIHAVKVSGEDELPGKVNYFLGNDPAKWRTDLPTYAQVHYSNVYPGVDMLYHGNQRLLEYDFVVAPGASAARIRLKFATADGLQPRIEPDGDLVLESANGEAVIHKPVIYQLIDGRRRHIAGGFRRITEDTLGFSLGNYDHNRPLVIDPVLVYSTYLGGSGTSHNGDQGNGIAVDSNGNAYVVGTTYSTNFPLAAPFQSKNNAALSSHGSTVFVTKLNATGTALVYSTYLGGSGSASGGDFGYAIGLDSQNNAYLTGATYSTDFPVTCGAFQAANPSTTAGATTAFVTRLNAAGNALVYSTYLGGNGNNATPAHGDVAQAIAVNATGDAYVTGYTYSSNFPTTDLAFQKDYAGDATASNAFVTKLNPVGTALEYSTYLGGSGQNGSGDYGNGIAIDAAGDAFVTGSTASSNFPATKGSLQTSLTGSSNAFVTELNPNGTDEVYSTYLGGNSSDSAQAIAIDSKGFAYLAGNTNSTNFPVTEGVLEGANIGIGQYYGPNGFGAFAAKLNLDGTALEYSTYLEGEATSVTGLKVDSSGAAYITGNAPTTEPGTFAGFQPTPDALPSPVSTGNVAFLVKLDPSATVLNYATLLGGTSSDGAVALALDAAGNAYLTGFASSTNFPVTSEAFEKTNRAAANSAANAFVSKFALAAEANETSYPALPSPAPTSMSIISQQASWINDGFCDEYIINVTVSLNTGINGPPPTGSIDFYGPWEDFYSYPVSGSWGGATTVSLFGAQNVEGNVNTYWEADYSGDSVYQPSIQSGEAPIPICTPSFSYDRPAPKANAPIATLRLQTPQGQSPSNSDPNLTTAASTPAKLNVPGAKFIPSPSIAANSLQGSEQTLPDSSSAENQGTAACIAPANTLTVTMYDDWRIYGAANPTFGYTITGLINGETVIVTPQTTATAASPVGTYPVTATVSGPDAANYTISVIPATLQVHKAPLYISAANIGILYGQTPPQPTVYGLAGFVNGDTAATAVTGAPVLTTSVTSTTPVGFYKIGVQVGTLSATNYYFDTLSNGEGVVGVYKDTLYIEAKNVAITYGQTPPLPLAYNLIGFVNGETAATATSGAPLLTTTVTSSTPVGVYRIGVALGTLTAANYIIKTTYSGMGSVEVEKAPLVVTANNLTMTQGGPVPALTYKLTGFVDGDTAATTVTGAPALTTTATSASKPGKYPIIISQGSLAATNYRFDTVNGVLTVVP